MALNRRKIGYWIAGIALAAAGAAGTLRYAHNVYSARFEPVIRQQAIRYLERRFNSKVQIQALHVRLVRFAPIEILFRRGQGALASVEGSGLVLKYMGREDLPPLFAVQRFRCQFDLGSLMDSPHVVPLLHLDGMQINIPPKGDRPHFNAPSGDLKASFNFTKTEITNARLVILPKDSSREPLDFAIHQLELTSSGSGAEVRYAARLTNARPPGEIVSDGTFGPWDAESPGDSPITGSYRFDHADLGVFKAIAGTLTSTGTFAGTLSLITARGEASVPDFRLKRAQNPVKLVTHFEVLVDGTNGNTMLKPVEAMLGSTHFTTSGAVIRHQAATHRTIGLNVTMRDGHLTDLIRLAMKGKPMMDGSIDMKAAILVPPLEGKVKDKLILDGTFTVKRGIFHQARIQDQIDNLSRRGQGQPKNNDIDDVLSGLSGSFHMEDQTMVFRSLGFSVPGARVALKGSSDLDSGAIQFDGSLMLDARVSQTLTGWKHWVAKPINPLFSKNGAGTFLAIHVSGTSKQPQFTASRGKSDKGNSGKKDQK